MKIIYDERNEIAIEVLKHCQNHLKLNKAFK